MVMTLYPGSVPMPAYANPTFNPYGLNAYGKAPAAPLPLYQTSISNPGKPFEVQLSAPKPLNMGQPGWLDLQVSDPRTGWPPAQLNIVHEKPAHIFIVNQDLSDFQHVHPEAMRPGLMRIPVQFNAPGPYRLFLQFTTPQHGEVTLNKPFQLGNGITSAAKPMFPDDHLPKMVEGYQFRVSGLPTRQQPMSMFHVEVLKNGMPVGNIQPYLGAGAHGVIISQDGQSFIHTHPMAEPRNGFYQSPIMFHTNIPQPGLYKMWVQTQIDGRVRTVDWTFRV